MNHKDIVESQKQQQGAQANRQNFWEKYGGAPLALIMRNPKVTPIILFVLAVTPLAIAALVLALVWRWQ